MGIFSGKNTEEESTSLEVIKTVYYERKNKKRYCEYYYTSLLLDIYTLFTTRLEMQFENKNLKDLQEALKNYDKDDLDTLKEKMNNIIKEENELKEKAEQEFFFYSDVLGNLWRNDGKGGDSCKNACEEIINNQIKSYINYEKFLITLKDKIKEIRSII